MGQKINKSKTKYMVVNSKYGNYIATFITVHELKFERVRSFVYLASLINETDDIMEEINRRIQASNKCYYGLQRHFKSKLLTFTSKCRIYKTFIRPVLMYGCESWTLSQSDINKFGSFERKILRRIYGLINEEENGEVDIIMSCINFMGIQTLSRP